MIKNHLLCIDLQTKLQHDALPVAGKQYFGILRVKLPSEGNVYGDQYLFTELAMPFSACHRNLRFFDGQHISMTCRPDGTPRLNFKYLNLDADFNIDGYCLEVANEIRKALKMLLEK